MIFLLPPAQCHAGDLYPPTAAANISITSKNCLFAADSFISLHINVYAAGLGGTVITRFITTERFPAVARQGRAPLKGAKKNGIINNVNHIAIRRHLNYKDKGIYGSPL